MEFCFFSFGNDEKLKITASLQNCPHPFFLCRKQPVIRIDFTYETCCSDKSHSALHWNELIVMPIYVCTGVSKNTFTSICCLSLTLVQRELHSENSRLSWNDFFRTRQSLAVRSALPAPRPVATLQHFTQSPPNPDVGTFSCPVLVFILDHSYIWVCTCTCTHTYCTHRHAFPPSNLMMNSCSCFSFDVLIEVILQYNFFLNIKCLSFLALTISLSWLRKALVITICEGPSAKYMISWVMWQSLDKTEIRFKRVERDWEIYFLRNVLEINKNIKLKLFSV